MTSEFVVKVLSRGPAEVGQRLWMRQLPTESRPGCGVRFSFDPAEREYDWLIVYDDLPRGDDRANPKHQSAFVEELACPREQTILVTSEPSSIKLYSSDYCQQFGHIFSSQEPWAIRHSHHKWTQVGLRWFYGHGKNHCRSFQEIENNLPLEKTCVISAACSSKAQRHTLHHRRLKFVRFLESQVNELEVFGHGIQPIDDKAESLDSFRYHVAIENHRSPHHWTEKLSDAFLGCTLPFYFGAPNAADYFPSESFIPINILDPESALQTIRQAIENNEYERRLPAILEARKLVLHQHQIFPKLAKFVREAESTTNEAGGKLVSRHLSRRGLGSSIRHFGERVSNQIRSAIESRRAA